MGKPAAARVKYVGPHRPGIELEVGVAGSGDFLPVEHGESIVVTEDFADVLLANSPEGAPTWERAGGKASGDPVNHVAAVSSRRPVSDDDAELDDATAGPEAGTGGDEVPTPDEDRTDEGA